MYEIVIIYKYIPISIFEAFRQPHGFLTQSNIKVEVSPGYCINYLIFTRPARLFMRTL